MNHYYKIFSGLYSKSAKKTCQECQDFIKEGAEILDLGCGSGLITKELQKKFKAKVLGVDVKDHRIVNIPFKIINGVNLPFSDNSFDVVLISYVLHHAHNPIALLREAKRVARDKIIIYEDLPQGSFSNFICQLHGISFNTFFQKEKGRTNFKTEEEWRDIFKKLGMRVIFEKEISTPFNPVLKKMFVLKK